MLNRLFFFFPAIIIYSGFNHTYDTKQRDVILASKPQIWDFVNTFSLLF